MVGCTIAGLYAVKCGLADSSLLLHIFVLYTARTSAHSKKHGFFNMDSKRGRIYWGDQMQKDDMGQACIMCGTKSDDFTGKHEGNRPVGRPRR